MFFPVIVSLVLLVALPAETFETCEVCGDFLASMAIETLAPSRPCAFLIYYCMIWQYLGILCLTCNCT